MNLIKVLIFFLIFLVSACTHPSEQNVVNDEQELRELLDNFLQGASENSSEIHERFWDEELIYTGSDGRRVSKGDILSSLDNGGNQESEPEFIYHSEEVQIQLYGDTAVVAFRLVAESENDSLNYYNTGTFRKSDGEWRAVAWQATRIP
ncbi:nuclear transport factor 2 family protein [Rhodohalobacter sp. SW132]|uniref:nuclear transport factor 2 family protein n=1 Tax=Rhodohalobacter sp. SW132 TaxID=2293433 RepID=UPI000E22AD66|nr:nuclear transport factor 2 family protein [Rhodohalobacter sp. SW132]REL38552.1 nuclear transport factor 2 family protein [Rhodohalobacter sp. SW132]